MKLAFWKPRNSNDGNAAIFEINERGAWLTCIPQDGPKSFDAGKRGVTKLGLSDAAEFLAVISGRKEGAGPFKDNKWGGLFHKSDKGSSIIGFSKGQYGYQLSLSIDRNGNKSRYSVGLTDGELELLRVFMEQVSLAAMYEMSQQKEVEIVAAASNSTSPDDDQPF